MTFDLEVRISPVGCERTIFQKRNAWVLARLQSFFILTCQQTGIGTSQTATEREIFFQEKLHTKFEIARAIIWRARHATRTAHQVGTNIKPHLRSNSLQDYLFQSK